MPAIRWSPIEPLNEEAIDADFAEIDGLNNQWLDIKESVEASNPTAYEQFNEELARSWAIETGIIEDGTAIGMGLATAVKRLQGSSAESRVVVLLTDGQNNRGEIDPVTAAQLAAALDIRVYAVGAGTRGVARVPVDDPLFGRRYAQMQVDIDEPTLQEVADLTDGRYFRATDRESLEAIWAEIDALETTEIEVEQFTRYGELFHLPLAAGLVLLLLEMTLGRTGLRKIP